MEFDEALERFGFVPSGERLPRGARVFVARPNPYLTYTVQAFDDGTALFSWEFAVGDYLATRGIQFGSDETLNQFAYPRSDTRGPQNGAWLAAAIDQARALLADVRFDDPR
ncbi:MAG TPA: hypothetical protein VF129_06170 [Actinomycetota bacterium]